MPHIAPGTWVLATDLHGFTALEVESLSGDEVVVRVDPRVGVRSEFSTLPCHAISHVKSGSEWEYIGA